MSTFSVFLFSDKSVGISTNGTFNVDTGEDTIINSPAVYLGLGAEEKMVLGDTLVALIEELCDALSKETHPTPNGPSGTPINAASYSAIKSKAKNILSAQNFTL